MAVAYILLLLLLLAGARWHPYGFAALGFAAACAIAHFHEHWSIKL
ncbi:MAG: hypothetical protein IKQ15_11800 [Kiritimatiellae bacterium]|nr:hypothetical protein [Kiritimatiellia bacterium]